MLLQSYIVMVAFLFCFFGYRWQSTQFQIFLRSELCVLTLLRSPSTSLLPQLHVKGSDHSAKSASGKLHLNMHTPLTQRSRSGLTMPLSGHSVGTNQESSSHAIRQGTLRHNRLNSLSHCRLILAYRVELVCAS